MIFLVLFFTSLLTFGQEPVKITQTQRAQLDAITIKDVPKGGPGIAVGIVKNGQIVYKNYAGYANLKDSVFIGKQSRFNIASNGKQFTAFAILNLIEKHTLSLEDDIRKYLPNLYKNIKTPIKIKHLLNHSSGIRDVYDLWSLQGITWWKVTFDNTDAMQLLEKQHDLNFESGTEYSYSNSNYILLAEIVKNVTGITFVAYTNKLFKDLDMSNTSFVSDYKNIAEPIAKPYFNFNTWKTYDWICNLYGDGNLFSTLEDQLQWETIIQTQQSDVFSKEILAKTQELIVNTTIEKYGYGVEFGEHKNVPYRFHEGSTGAWKAVVARFPAADFSIVTMINSGKIDPTGQTLEMADVLLNKTNEKETFRITPEKIGAMVTIEDVLGIYRTKGGYIMKFEKRDGDLYMLRWGRNDMKLIREADNVFQQWNDAPFKQEFTKNADGIMQITAYYPTVKPFTLTRIESDFSKFDFNALNGTFKNQETDVSFTLKHTKGTAYEVKIGKKKREGLLLTPNELLVNEYSVKFCTDKTGNITELFVTSGRIQHVRFVRE